MTRNSLVFADANNQYAPLFSEMWQEINSKLIAAFLVCTVTMGKRGKKVTLKLNYVKVYVTVDMRATFFVDHESLPSINISDPSV